MKLLVADDSSVSRMMLSAVTKEWGYEVIVTENGEEAWEEMQKQNAPRLLLLDWEMPIMNGIEVCQRVVEKYQDNPPYILLLTSRTESDDIVEGLSKGANDYISKPFDTAELQVRLQVGKRMLEMQDKLNATLKEMRDLASHDALTGILNRRAILEALPKEIKRVERQNRVLCIGMCDIDHFKAINDTHGHLAGDEVLIEVTKRMQTALRVYDLIGRYGGEEFLVIVNTDSDNLLTTFERICQIISETPINIGESSINVTISCGVTLYQDDNNDMTSILARADKALYKAKNSGRNQVVLFDSN